MNQEFKLCKDCKHVIQKTATSEYRCGHPKMQRVDLVTGEQDSWYCHILRNTEITTSVIKCSKRGELWERVQVPGEIEYNGDGVDRR